MSNHIRQNHNSKQVKMDPKYVGFGSIGVVLTQCDKIQQLGKKQEQSKGGKTSSNPYDRSSDQYNCSGSGNPYSKNKK